MKKKEVKTYTPDEVRQKILAYLGECRKKARGLDSLMASSADIKKALAKEGISQNDTVQNLDYLVQHGWVNEKVIKRPYKTPRGFEVPNEKHLFGLSEVGLKYIEGESEFDRASVYSGINITNIGGVTVVGSNNVVRNEFVDILRALTQLEGVVKISDKLSEEQKLDVQADIQTIKNQLSKSSPDKSILQKAMESISFVGSLPGVVEVFKVASQAVQRILGL
jgi:hypothetical protein